MSFKLWFFDKAPFLVALAVSLTALGALEVVEAGQALRRVEAARVTTMNQLSGIRAALEGDLNATLLLTRGIAASITARGEMSGDEFELMARDLIGGRDEVRNIGLASGTVITKVFPREGNEKVLGLDYAKVPTQWSMVERAIQTRATIVDGPLELAQGGRGVISRTPIFSADQTRFIGVASIVIDLDKLLERAGLNNPQHSLRIVARDAQGRVFLGEPQVLEQAPVEQDVLFPQGSWRLAAVPMAGWEAFSRPDDSVQHRLGVGLVLATVLASFGTAWVARSQRLDRLRLEESEHRYRAVLDNAPVAVFLHRGGKILFTNGEAARMLGASGPDELASHGMLDLIHPDYLPVVKERIRAVSQDGVRAPLIEEKMVGLDGRIVDVEMAAVPIVLDGVPTVLALASDVSQRARAQAESQALFDALQRSNEELRQFAYVASHDLQEPLRQVASYVQLLQRRFGEHFDADARDYVGYAVEGVKRMQALILDLLSYSRVEQGGGQMRVCDAGQCLSQARENLQLALERSGARLSCERLPPVTADPGQLTQLFQNLLSNAIKYSTGGTSPEVQVGALRDGHEWRFFVRDNGIGIAPEYHQQIFNIFQRLHGRGQFEGTGIGLAICRKIVERHGGRLWVDSQEGTGSTFWFTLPAA